MAPMPMRGKLTCKEIKNTALTVNGSWITVNIQE